MEKASRFNAVENECAFNINAYCMFDTKFGKRENEQIQGKCKENK